MDRGNDAAEHLRSKAYEAFASGPENTDRQLNATADLVETVANFSLTGAKGAQKKFMRKIKRTEAKPNVLSVLSADTKCCVKSGQNWSGTKT